MPLRLGNGENGEGAEVSTFGWAITRAKQWTSPHPNLVARLLRAVLATVTIATGLVLGSPTAALGVAANTAPVLGGVVVTPGENELTVSFVVPAVPASDPTLSFFARTPSSGMPGAQDRKCEVVRFFVGTGPGDATPGSRLSCTITGLIGGRSYPITTQLVSNTSGQSPNVLVTGTPLYVPSNGVAVLNPTGCANSNGSLTTYFSNGQLQICRNGAGQLYSSRDVPPTSSMYNYFALGIGDGTSGDLVVPSSMLSDGRMSQTDEITLLARKQGQIANLVPFDSNNTVTTGNSFVSTLSVTIQGRTYSVVVTGTYTAPNSFLSLSTQVVVPSGNASQVRLYHVIDTMFQGVDEGPGFYRAPTSTCSSQELGVFQGQSLAATTPVEALQYVGGLPWTSYREGDFRAVVFGRSGSDPGQFKLNSFPNTIDTSPRTDNSVGVEYHIGSAPGSYTTTNNLVFTQGTPACPPPNVIAATPSLPGAVVSPEAVAGDTQVAVTWTAPSSNGSPIYRYTVTASPGGRGCFTTGDLTCTVSGLTNGTPYSFSVVAWNARGRGVFGFPAEATPFGPPSAPLNPSATPGATQATVSWSTPASNGGSRITSYTVTSSPGSRTCTTAGVLSCTITGLTAGTPYTFSIRAANAGGSGPPAMTSPVTPTNPATPPSAVLDPVATVSGLSSPVSWTAPASNGGSPITGYTVTSSPGGRVCATTGALTCTVAGLSPTTSYTFSVVATNVAATGPAGTSNQITTPGLPSAPTNLSVSDFSDSARVYWSASNSDGGSPITNYTVTASPGGASCSFPAAGSCLVYLNQGLTSQTNYTFSVAATNAVGTGPAATIVIPRAPSAVLNPTATALNGEAMVSWTPPASSGTSSISSYLVTASPGGQTCTYTVVVPEVDACRVSGLTNGTPYTFAVVARSSVGNGPAGTSNQVTPMGPPSAPRTPSTTAGNGLATVSWTTPASDGGSPIAGYTVTSSPGGQSCTTTTALTCAVAGLTNGTSYTFTITARNGVGTGPAATTSPATPHGPPSAVLSPVATAGNAQATVTWTAPASNGGSPITDYSVTSSPGSKTCTTTGQLSCTVTGLTNGTQYTFAVVAINAAGTGGAGTSNPVTPSTTPSAPLSPMATPDNTLATISWSIPTSNGGSPITGYTVTASPGSKTCTTSGQLSCTITGLTNGTAYTFSVVARNANGNGPAATTVPVTPVAPVAGPSAVLTPVATAGNAQATVTWAAPISSGSSPITGYTVTASPGSQTCTTTGALTCTVTGLTNGVTYVFDVVATNSSGDGPAGVSNQVTPSAPPSAALNPTAVAGNARAAVSWTPPASNGGSPITSYLVTAVPGGQTCTYSVVVPETDTCTVTGLTNGTKYSFTVVATNGAGDGPAGTSNQVTPSTVPTAPLTPSATAGNAKATVSWTVPSSDGGSPITGYTVTSSPGGFTCTTSGALTWMVSGLTNGTAYTFSIVATNANGNSPAATTSPVTPVTAPSAVINPLATAGNAQATVKWSPPASTGGSPITGYTVTSSPGGFTCTTSGDLSCTVTGLTNGTKYSFTVVATNGAGDGPSGTSNQVTPATVPTAPLTPSATSGNSQATISWTTPSSNGGSPITGYTVTASPGSHICATTGALTCVITGLNNGTSYTFSITATNLVGTGSEATTRPVTPATKPSAVINPLATAGNAQATARWAEPALTGGSPITGYTVTSSPGGFTCTTSGALSCTVTGLTNGTKYSFTVVATNGAGDGPAGTSNQVTPSTVPTAPLTPSATAGNAKATVSWTVPSSDGGSPITGYTVTSSPGGFTCTTSGALTCTVTGLTNGTAYTFSIVATNANGDSPAATTSPSTPASVPSAVINPSAAAGNSQATITWTAPASTGGSPITGYTVTSSPGGFTCTTSGDLSCTVTGLTNGTLYSFTVKAITTVGTGPAGLSNPVIPATVPSAPRSVEAIPRSGQVLVAWDAPASNGGSAITGYTVTASPGGAICTTTGAYSCAISGLSNGTAYTFSFTATNGIGTGPAADTTPAGTPADVPSVPLSPGVVPHTTSATVSWSTPVTDGGSPITGYIVVANGTSQSCTYAVGSGSPVNTCTVNDLSADEYYTFIIVATNAVGSSSQATAAALVGAFACTPGTFLESRLGHIQSTTDFTNWTMLGAEAGFVNAIGYRPADGFLYGVGASGAAFTGTENHLFRIAGNGVIKDLGLIQGLPTRDVGLKFPAGDFNPGTDRLIVASGRLIYSIDVTTLQATRVSFPAGAQPFGWDLVAQGDWLWTVTPTALEGINMVTHAFVTTTLPGSFGISGHGAMWSSIDGQSVYFESNATGNIYKATGLSGTPGFSQVGHLGAAPNMDGASCTQAP